MKLFGKLLLALVVSVVFTNVVAAPTPAAAGEINTDKIVKYTLKFSQTVQRIVLDGGIILAVESDPLRQRGTIHWTEDGRCFRTTVNGTRVRTERVNCRHDDD